MTNKTPQEIMAQGIADDTLETIKKRYAIYLRKHEHSDPFGDDIFSRREALKYVLEAFEVLWSELGQETDLEREVEASEQGE